MQISQLLVWMLANPVIPLFLNKQIPNPNNRFKETGNLTTITLVYNKITHSCVPTWLDTFTNDELFGEHSWLAWSIFEPFQIEFDCTVVDATTNGCDHCMAVVTHTLRLSSSWTRCTSQREGIFSKRFAFASQKMLVAAWARRKEGEMAQCNKGALGVFFCLGHFCSRWNESKARDVKLLGWELLRKNATLLFPQRKRLKWSLGFVIYVDRNISLNGWPKFKEW